MGRADGRVADLTKVVDNGSPSERFNLVLLSEGYIQSEISQFVSDAGEFVDVLFQTPPFDELRASINIYRIDVVSNESGIDVTARCGDNTVLPGRQAATFFDGKDCSWGVRRLLEIDEGLAISITRHFVPEWHSILVIANSTLSAGAGGSVARTSRNGAWKNTAIHELGHSAFGLADEYEYALGCGLDTDRNEFGHLRLEPDQPNITREQNFSALKWRALVTPSIPVPTLRNADCTACDRQPSPVPTGTVGSFEGAGYYHCLLFRPEFDCMMRNVGSPFCAVCRQRIRERLAPFMPPPSVVAAAVAPPSWSDVRSGRLITNDGDELDYLIEAAVVGNDVVDFILMLGPGVTWKKELNLPDGEGSSWDIVVDGSGDSSSEMLWAHQVQNGQSLTFKKSKFLGHMWGVFSLGDLDRLTPGSRVTFTWRKD